MDISVIRKVVDLQLVWHHFLVSKACLATPPNNQREALYRNCTFLKESDEIFLIQI